MLFDPLQNRRVDFLTLNFASSSYAQRRVLVHHEPPKEFSVAGPWNSDCVALGAKKNTLKYSRNYLKHPYSIHPELCLDDAARVHLTDGLLDELVALRHLLLACAGRAAAARGPMIECRIAMAATNKGQQPKTL